MRVLHTALCEDNSQTLEDWPSPHSSGKWSTDMGKPHHVSARMLTNASRVVLEQREGDREKREGRQLSQQRPCTASLRG